MTLRNFLTLQFWLAAASLAGVLVKAAGEAWSQSGFWSRGVWGALAGAAALLALYAAAWQGLLKRLPLTAAYFNRGLGLFWSLAWAVLLCGESLSFFNLLGAAVIFAGLTLMNRP